jgi:nucleoside-diphosphate-sugar epimerase
MKVFITGITGFIGRHLSKRLVNDGIEVSAIVRKRKDVESFENDNISCFLYDNRVHLGSYFENEGFDGIIHLASCFIKEHIFEDIDDLISSNILFSTKILESAVEAGIPWFINTGTFWQHYNNETYSPVNLYAATKQAFEDIARYYIQSSDTYFVTLKLNDTYGPGDTRPKIFNMWKDIAETGKTLEMSPGEQMIDIVYIDDVVDAYVKLMNLLTNNDQKRNNLKSFAVSSGKVISLKDLAEIFSHVSGKKLNILWGKTPYRKNEVMIPWNRGNPVPEWEPRVSLEEGIKKLFK